MALDFSQLPEELISSLGKLVGAQYEPQQLHDELVALEQKVQPILDEIHKAREHVAALIGFAEPEVHQVVEDVQTDATTAEAQASQDAQGVEEQVHQDAAVVENQAEAVATDTETAVTEAATGVEQDAQAVADVVDPNQPQQ